MEALRRVVEEKTLGGRIACSGRRLMRKGSEALQCGCLVMKLSSNTQNITDFFFFFVFLPVLSFCLLPSLNVIRSFRGMLFISQLIRTVRGQTLIDTVSYMLH
jgi:hypothetical protein